MFEKSRANFFTLIILTHYFTTAVWGRVVFTLWNSCTAEQPLDLRRVFCQNLTAKNLTNCKSPNFSFEAVCHGFFWTDTLCAGHSNKMK